MSEWTVVGVIIALVGLFFTVGKPIINLNTNIVRLNASLEATQKEQNEYEKSNHETHARLWKHNEKQDAMLEEHKLRLHDLDGK